MESNIDVGALLEKLRVAEEENAKLKNQLVKKPSGLTFKVSEKGALSIYGLNRFPVTLYKNQWLQVFEKAEEIKLFIKDNDDKLHEK
jgi:hypothetical protein